MEKTCDLYHSTEFVSAIEIFIEHNCKLQQQQSTFFAALPTFFVFFLFIIAFHFSEVQRKTRIRANEYVTLIRKFLLIWMRRQTNANSNTNKHIHTLTISMWYSRFSSIFLIFFHFHCLVIVWYRCEAISLSIYQKRCKE